MSYFKSAIFSNTDSHLSSLNHTSIAVVLNRSDFAPQGTFANVWRYLELSQLGVGDDIGIWWIEGMDVAKHLQCIGSSPQLRTRGHKMSTVQRIRHCELQSLLMGVPAFFSSFASLLSPMSNAFLQLSHFFSCLFVLQACQYDHKL